MVGVSPPLRFCLFAAFSVLLRPNDIVAHGVVGYLSKVDSRPSPDTGTVPPSPKFSRFTGGRTIAPVASLGVLPAYPNNPIKKS